MADDTKLTAATRIEKLLDNIAGGENDVTPATRLEKFLSYIADAMEGGGSGGESGGVELNKKTVYFMVNSDESLAANSVNQIHDYIAKMYDFDTGLEITSAEREEIGTSDIIIPVIESPEARSSGPNGELGVNLYLSALFSNDEFYISFYTSAEVTTTLSNLSQIFKMTIYYA